MSNPIVTIAALFLLWVFGIMMGFAMGSYYERRRERKEWTQH